MAWSPASLIWFRFLQGLGAGAIASTAMAIIFRVFPPQQRGLGMGVYSIGWTFGPILGPTLGGYLTDTVSWRAIFYINLPPQASRTSALQNCVIVFAVVYDAAAGQPVHSRRPS